MNLSSPRCVGRPRFRRVWGEIEVQQPLGILAIFTPDEDDFLPDSIRVVLSRRVSYDLARVCLRINPHPVNLQGALYYPASVVGV